MSEFFPNDEGPTSKQLSAKEKAALQDLLFQQSSKIERTEKLRATLNQELLSATEVFSSSKDDLTETNISKRFEKANMDALKVLDNLNIILREARRAHEVNKQLMSPDLCYYLENNYGMAQRLVNVLPELSYTISEVRVAISLKRPVGAELSKEELKERQDARAEQLRDEGKNTNKIIKIFFSEYPGITDRQIARAVYGEEDENARSRVNKITSKLRKDSVGS